MYLSVSIANQSKKKKKKIKINKIKEIFRLTFMPLCIKIRKLGITKSNKAVDISKNTKPISEHVIDNYICHTFGSNKR